MKNKAWPWLILAFFMFACIDLGTPAAADPQADTNPVFVSPVAEATLTPFSPALTEVTFTLAPIILPVDTLVPTVIPSSTNTNLPPLPDFGQLLAMGEGGGGGSTCMAPVHPPPVVYAQRSSYGAHVAGICIYDVALPINIPIHVALISPDGIIALQGDFQSMGGPAADWLGAPEYKAFKGYADSCDGANCRYWGMEFWWPANLPDNTWRVSLSWNGGEVQGMFDTGNGATLPEASVQDALVYSALRPAETYSGCHPVSGPSELMVAGRGFPANAVVYVPVYEHVEGKQFRFLNAQILVADGYGTIHGVLNSPFQSGKKYAIAGVTDATLSLIAPDKSGLVSFVNLANAADCFYVP